MSKIQSKQVEIFCGTGGVGKTTIATARALSLAREGNKVLLITIDPAKRLKQILNLKDNLDGEIHHIKSEVFELEANVVFDAMLMSPGSTLKKIASENGLDEEFKTTILETLSRPNSGMNEIMSIIELQFQIEKKYYDTIVLDTPPGKHFIDFLESSEKIKNFFDKSFLDIFEYLGKSTSSKKPQKGFFVKLVSTGLNKLLSYLEKVTGTEFVEDFINSVLVLYKCKDAFLKALTFQEDLKRVDFSNWFLVTSIEQQKLNEATALNLLAEKFLHQDNYLIINKCLSSDIYNWIPENNDLLKLKNSYLKKERMIEEYSREKFKKIIKLNEVTDSKPNIHVEYLAQQFSKISQKAVHEL